MEITSPATDQSLIDRHAFFRLAGVSVGAIPLTRCVSGCARSIDPELRSQG